MEKRLPQQASLAARQDLPEALGLRRREMISLTGAGGKTTLMFQLARALRVQGRKVITTTTTKINEPSEEGSPLLFVSKEEGETINFVRETLDKFGHITLGRERIEGKKLKGIPPDFADHLWKSLDIDFMIIEADGAAGRPVKAPRSWEPVIPSQTSLVIGLLGLDGVGKVLSEEEVFQPLLISDLTGIPLGGKMTEEGMAVLMVHPEGLFKGAPPSSRRVAFLNKVDVPDGLARGKAVARVIFGKGSPIIERVVLGSLKGEPNIVGVFFQGMRGEDGIC